MSHIGLVAPAYTGHINPMITLGHELLRRGHQVSLISTPDAEAAVVRSNASLSSAARSGAGRSSADRGGTSRGGLAFVPVGAAQFPVGSLERFTDRQGRLVGLRAIRFNFTDLARIAAAHERDLPGAVRENGVDALVVDQFQPIGAAVAQSFDIPYVSLCNHMPLNTDLSVPPWMMPWAPGDPARAGTRRRNSLGYRARDLAERPLHAEAGRIRARWGLAPVSADEAFSSLAQIAQIPAFFDFPREQAPECFHHTGPLTDFSGAIGGADPLAFPWDALDGRPLIYAAMGTLQNRSERVFRIIAEACAGLDAQLVIALGRRGARIPADFPGNPIIVDYAPQVELLARASLYIGHGGMNSALHALAHGVPMVILPAAADNAGVAARAKHLGVGEFIPVTRLSARKLRAAIERVQAGQSYRDNALKYQNAVRDVDGAGRAADIAEEAFRTRRPVIRTAP